MGVAIHQKVSFPVGKVEFMNLYPLNFTEFLMALKQDLLLKFLTSRNWNQINVFKSKLIELLKQYFYVGGMPAVVLSFVQNKDYNEVRQTEKNIFNAFEHDFLKYPPTEITTRIRMLWNSSLVQLGRENKKFIYSALKKGESQRF